MMVVLEMKEGGGLLVQKFLRYRVYGSYGISVVNTKMFINKKLDKESWHCKINSGSNMCASCHRWHPTIWCHFLVPRLNISLSNLFLWLL